MRLVPDAQVIRSNRKGREEEKKNDNCPEGEPRGSGRRGEKSRSEKNYQRRGIKKVHRRRKRELHQAAHRRNSHDKEDSLLPFDAKLLMQPRDTKDRKP